MSAIARLSGALFSMAESLPPALVTAELCRELGATRVEPFLGDQASILTAVSRHDGSVPAGSAAPRVIYGSAGELVNVAMEHGLRDHLSLVCTGLLCDSVFTQGGSGWPEPVRHIGRMIHDRDRTDGLPWTVAALPLGWNLYIRGRHVEGLTTSPEFGERIAVPPNEGTGLVVQTAERLRARKARVPAVTTLLGGSLWQSESALLPKAALHEASHVANFLRLGRWIDGNAGRPPEARDAAFTRHCFFLEGAYRVDFAFATLFLELAACIATGTFFDTIVQSGEPSAFRLQTLVNESVIRGAHYMADAAYAPYLAQAGIPTPDFRSLGSVMKAMQTFVDQIPSL